jgi:hypothetical protein
MDQMTPFISPLDHHILSEKACCMSDVFGVPEFAALLRSRGKSAGLFASKDSDFKNTSSWPQYMFKIAKSQLPLFNTDLHNFQQQGRIIEK